MSSVRSNKVFDPRKARKLLWKLFVFAVIPTIWLAHNYETKKLQRSKQPVSEAITPSCEMPVCADVADVLLDRKHPERQIPIQESCLSGIIKLPPNTRFKSNAPDWAEYWFITSNGYDTWRITDSYVNKRMTPSSAFRMRGKSGLAKIAIIKT